MRLSVPREVLEGERRVALVPDVVRGLVDGGWNVAVGRDAGFHAGHADAAYVDAGATISDDDEALYGADVVVKVNRPMVRPDGKDELELLGSSSTLIGMLSPLADAADVRRIAERDITSFAMELIPRISRAQSMDVLSSMSTIAGYKAVLIGADRLGKMFPMLMTAAGTVAPAKVLVIGAGVAGLQAIATARRLGAVVSSYDTRAAVKEQIQSLGAKFLEWEGVGDAEAAGGYARELTAEEQAAQAEWLAGHVSGSDVVVTTALVPGRPAPKIIPTSAVEAMRAGSVIVDLASEAGGNCELAKHGEEVIHSGVRIVGPSNLPSTVPVHASQMYAKNVANFLALMTSEGSFEPDFDDEIVSGTCATRRGEVVHPLIRKQLGLPELALATGSPA